MATGMVKVRFLKRKSGTVPVKEVLDVFNQEHIVNEANELAHD